MAATLFAVQNDDSMGSAGDRNSVSEEEEDIRNSKEEDENGPPSISQVWYSYRVEQKKRTPLPWFSNTVSQLLVLGGFHSGLK